MYLEPAKRVVWCKIDGLGLYAPMAGQALARTTVGLQQVELRDNHVTIVGEDAWGLDSIEHELGLQGRLLLLLLQLLLLAAEDSQT